MPDFVLEVGTEEVPAGVVVPALNQMEALFRELFARERIAVSEVRTLGTPRRLVVLASGVAPRQEDAVVEQRGPARKAAFGPDGAPTRAAEGFARRYGLAPSDLVARVVGNAEYMFALQQVVGRSTIDVLADAIPGVLASLTFPKFMRWGEGQHRFCRPIRWLVALLDDAVVPAEVAGVRAGRISRGHRFLPVQQPGPVGEAPALPARFEIEIERASDYLAAMERAQVVVDPEERRRRIVDGAEALAAAEGVRIAWDPDLLHEVVYVVEHPTAFLGRFQEEYLALPRPVLVSAMKKHQRYFTVEEPDGSLAARFLAVRNGGAFGLDQVRAGNERVLTFRFNDAAHHATEDAKSRLEDFREKLRRIVFLEKLGSLWDRSQRLERVIGGLCEAVGAPELVEKARRAAQLCKADLATHMVAELPELQGVMGRVYAARDGEDPEVAAAIEAHYRPRTAGDALPDTLLARLLALADRADLLVAAFSLGYVPTGSSDPFGLRRAAQGVVALLLGLPPALHLTPLLLRSRAAFAEEAYFEAAAPQPADQVLEELGRFLRPRVEAMLEEAGIRRDLSDAVLSAGFESLPGALARARFLQGRLDDPSWKRVVIVGTRLRNILKPADGEELAGDPARLEHPTELGLAAEWQAARVAVEAATAREDWDAAWQGWTQLDATLDRFFVDVLVNAPDPGLRAARLTLLRELHAPFARLADFSRIADIE